ncbi:kinesin-like protein KIF26B [Engraulis encrasicolus]|uniref:kinesin-like protein KIF26B n=1 Tax=Engraulis encrasicolus TaxID=184585 RepID=UPI002FCEC608
MTKQAVCLAGSGAKLARTRGTASVPPLKARAPQRQALRLLIHNKNPDDPSGAPLCAMEAWYEGDGHCDVCATNLRQLKQKALHTILTQEQAIWTAQSAAASPSGSSPTASSIAVSLFGHVKVMLRVVPGADSPCLKVEGRRRQVTVLDPAAATHNPQQQTPQQQTTTAAFRGAQRSFTFDAVFTPESMQGEVCEGVLPGLLQAVLNGADGCVLGFGRAGTGKSYTMTGRDDSILSLGLIPCAISWLFRLLTKRKERSGADISVSVSAIELYGRNELLRDLLSAEDTGTGTGTGMAGGGSRHKPDLCLYEDPVSGIQLKNHNVISAPTAERAATLLDSALTSRCGNRPGASSHMFFTLHVHQQQGQGPNKELMCGAQSRLILIDLGSCVEEHSKSMTQLTFPELSSVILSLLRGHKQISNRSTKMTMLLQESLGNVNCQTTVIAHVSGSSERAADTLSTMQIVSRIHKTQRKAKKSRSSSPSERSVHRERKWLQETKLRAFHSTGTLDPDDIPVPRLLRDVVDRSASEQSCDTVIHVDSDGCNAEVNKKSQESISIIPSLLKGKTEGGGSPVLGMKLRPQRTFLKDFRLIHRSQEEKEPKTAAGGTQDEEMECLKCSTFAELQERLGCIDGSELMNQATDSKSKSQPALTEIKKEAEKTDMSKAASTVQLNTAVSSYMAACEPNASDCAFTVSYQCDPSSHNQAISDKQLITDSLGNSTTSRSQTSASESEQYSADSSTCPESPVRDNSLPFETAKSQGPSSDESLQQQDHRISPIGKSSSKSSSSGSSLSSSSMSTSTDSAVTLPANLSDATPHQLSADAQREMKATITVTVQQPFDLNGQDELVYTVVEEVTISGMAEKGRPANVISFSEGSALPPVVPSSQPVRIISSVSDDGNVQDHAAKMSEAQRQTSSIETASLSRAWHSMDQEDGFDDDFPSSPGKDHRALGEAMSTPCSPAATLERRRSRSRHGLFARAKENFSSGRRDSPDQKRRANSQSSLPRSPVLHHKSSFSHNASDESCRRKHVRSPIEDSSKLFSAKLEQLSHRSPIAHGLRPEYSDFFFSEQDNFMTCANPMERFESDSSLPRASRSARRYPKFLPMDDGESGCVKSSSKSNLSKVSAVNKLMMSSSKPGSSNKSSSTSGSKTLNLTTRSLRQSTRSSSLSPDETTSGFGSWSTQSLSRSQVSSLSPRPSLKILNGRITEFLRGSGTSSTINITGGAGQASSVHKDKGAAKDSEDDQPLPSPYSRVTAPRLPSSHCSGHASDTTSVLSGELPPAMGKTSLLCNRNSVVSSGYESLMRDGSEVTGSSMSIRESFSDHSCTHSLARSSRSSKRRNSNSPAGTTQRRPSQETLLSLRRSTSGPRVRWGDRGAADSYELKVYEIDNVDCLQRRGLSSDRGVACFSAKLKFLEHRQQRIVELRSKYSSLKRELEQAKQYLMLDPDKWTQEFDLWQTFEVDSLEHLEALELVTARLESRVNLCKARMMMVTSFDAAPKRKQRRAKRHRPSPDHHMGFL